MFVDNFLKSLNNFFETAFKCLNLKLLKILFTVDKYVNNFFMRSNLCLRMK